MKEIPRAWVLLFATAIAAPGVTAEQKQPDKAPPVKPPQGQSVPSNGRSVTPPSTFTPSEKIKADSSVAFPVDI